MNKWLIFSLVALFSFPAMADQPKLRGPSRSLSCRPSISSMKNRNKPHAMVHADTRHRRSLLNGNRRGLLLNRNRHENHYYRPPQPIIVVVRVLPSPIPEPEPRPIIVRPSTHVTIFSQSTPNSKRFGDASRGLIIFPKKPGSKTQP